MNSLVISIITILSAVDIKVSLAETCYYNYEELKTSFVCYTGCCDDQCCGDWNDASLAGILTGSLFGIILFLLIIAMVTRLCCNTGRYRRHHYRSRQIAIISAGSDRDFPNNPFPVPVLPPSYEQAVHTELEPPPSYTPYNNTDMHTNYNKY